MTHPPQLTEQLREAALKATRGPWEWRETGKDTSCHMRTLSPGVLVLDNIPGAGGPWGDEIDRANAAYIALANPATILALLNHLDALTAERDRLREAFQALTFDQMHIETEGGHPERITYLVAGDLEAFKAALRQSGGV